MYFLPLHNSRTVEISVVMCSLSDVTFQISKLIQCKYVNPNLVKPVKLVPSVILLDKMNCIVNQIWLRVWKESLIDPMELMDTN